MSHPYLPLLTRFFIHFIHKPATIFGLLMHFKHKPTTISHKTFHYPVAFISIYSHTDQYIWAFFYPFSNQTDHYICAFLSISHLSLSYPFYNQTDHYIYKLLLSILKPNSPPYIFFSQAYLPLLYLGFFIHFTHKPTTIFGLFNPFYTSPLAQLRCHIGMGAVEGVCTVAVLVIGAALIAVNRLLGTCDKTNRTTN